MDGVIDTFVDEEQCRLAALYRYGTGVTGQLSALDRLAARAARQFGTAIGFVSFVGREVTEFQYRSGFDVASLPREATFCSLVIGADQPLVVPDGFADDRFAALRPTLATLGARFYAGAPLIAADGSRIGVISVMDAVPRHDFGAREQATLVDLAQSAMSELELHRQLTESRRVIDALSLRQTLNDIATGAATLTAALDAMLVPITRTVGALYCGIYEGDLANGTFRAQAFYAENPAFSGLINTNQDTAGWPLSDLICGAALTNGILCESGPLDAVKIAGRNERLDAALNLGLQSLLGVPLAVGARRFMVSFAFNVPEIDPMVRSTCHDLVRWVTPILQGRLREAELAKANARLDRSNRALQTILACNATIHAAHDEPDMVQRVCDQIVAIGGFQSVWIGAALHDAEQTVRPVAKAGRNLVKIEMMRISWADNIYGRGPAGTAIRERRAVVIDDLATAPGFAPWRAQAAIGGFTSALSLPLIAGQDMPFGCITLYANDRSGNIGGAFDAEEVRLLTQLADDLAHGVQALRTRAAHDAALSHQAASEQRLVRLLDASPTVIYALPVPQGNSAPHEWQAIEVSSNIERLFGHTVEAALKPGWWIAHVHPEDRDAVLAARRQLLIDGQFIHRYRFARADGVYRWLRDEKNLVRDAAGTPVSIVGAWFDITEKQQADEDIHRLAYYDPLTGLPNRAMLQRQLGMAQDSACTVTLVSALLFIDLDGFKAVNDLHGHQVGDAVLVQIGRRLPAALRRKDIVFRLGGDEFIVLLPDLAEQPTHAGQIAHRIADNLRATITEPINAGTIQHQLGASIGIALFGADTPVDDILRQADIAMYQAKASDVVKVRFFEPAMHARVTKRHAIEQTLHDALDNDRFEVWLQSQVNREGHVIGAEALIRLREPDGTILSPAEFIRIAEQTGIIIPIGRWIIRTVCTILATEAAAGTRLQISVNVSPRQFREPGFVAEVLAALADTGADPHDLMIEITETLLIDRIEETTEILNTLAARGIRFSVDDFGTGYSSLGYLQSLPIAEVKIDRCFISPLPNGERDAILAEAILVMTRHIGLATVAEGVETAEQAAFLRAHHCDLMQGYLFGRPEPASEWLARWRKGEAPRQTDRALIDGTVRSAAQN